ncbi:MAG: phosphoglycolate phosphatase [Alphaproteobacteria bacterium]|jgi:phosphoglycolate phosphatase|nr:phosphoglycolate phosphatase [Rhodospirillaceae bacterium]MDP6404814.1 phosphoglycolate phosphatase [Alphaproteobacteria bacterium]MDP6624813.1 phosphoglycolate phosphatase [Alphaproteobacteria bacterium]|tara:strand:- start:2073 stop:2741 length:669 start_codon:yes stop_codon:yes gene_type:complete
MTTPAIIFDLDGTLAETVGDLCAATNHALASIGRPALANAEVRDFIGHGLRQLIGRGLEHTGGALSEAQVDELLERAFTFYAANLSHHSAPFAEVPEVLEGLRQAGHALAVCTNKPMRFTTPLLADLGLDGYFSVVMGGDSVAVRKPDPGHLLAVVEALGEVPTNVIMVGDSQTDVSTARAAGIPVVAVSFGYSQVPAAELGADALIDHFSELPAAIAGLGR